MQVQTHVLIKNPKGIKAAEKNIQDIFESYFSIILMQLATGPKRSTYLFHNYNELLNSCSCTFSKDRLIFKFYLKKTKLIPTKEAKSLKNIFKEIKKNYLKEVKNKPKVIKLTQELIINTRAVSIY